MDMVLELKHALYLNLIKDARYLYILNGLKNTLVITFFAVLIGIFFGFLIANLYICRRKIRKDR